MRKNEKLDKKIVSLFIKLGYSGKNAFKYYEHKLIDFIIYLL